MFTSPQGIRLADLRDQRSLEPLGDEEALKNANQLSRLRTEVSRMNSKCAQYERDKRKAEAACNPLELNIK